MAEEHQEYIQTKVNPTLENLVTQVLLERPENPVPFMVKWLAEQTQQAKSSLAQSGAGEAERLRNEVRALQEEVRELEAKLGRTSGAPAAAAEAEEEEEDDDEGDEMELPAAGSQRKGPRASVSAEAYGDWNRMKAFKAPVNPKSEERRQKLQTVLRHSFLFATLESSELDVVVGAMVEKRVEANVTVIQEGDSGDNMFVIEEGTVDCLKGSGAEQRAVKQCGPGDFFGELALLYNCPRAASVRSREPCLLWQLDRGTFIHIVRDSSIHKREQHEEFLAQVPLLESLGKYERSQIADALQKETVTAGTVVIKQGEEGSKFYLVEEGELSAQRADGDGRASPSAKKCYKRGDYFGELALLEEGDVRAATVVADTDAKLLWVERKVFERLLGTLKEVLKTKAAQYS